MTRKTETFTATYYRYGGHYSEEFATAKEAAQFLYDGETYGTLSYDSIIDPDGRLIAEHGNAGYEPLYALGASADDDEDEYEVQQ